MIFSESPKGLALDGSLAVWSAFVVLKSLPTLIALGTFIALVLRIMILWRQWKAGK